MEERLEISELCTVTLKGRRHRLPKGYRLRLILPGRPQNLALTVSRHDDMRFHRLIDAQMAKCAMEAAGLTTLEAIREAGWQKIKETALSGLQW